MPQFPFSSGISRRFLTLFLFVIIATGSCKESEPTLPNIVIIYADDMGYGDLNAQNPESKIPTPYLDQLVEEGMRFTDGHSSSGICSPSRFALLTGSYHWRRQHEIVLEFGKPFFSDNDITLPQLLKTKGYTTACIGKWHLGWDWEISHTTTSNKNGKRMITSKDIDWSQPVSGGPLDRGFDYYFGDGTINFPPYTWMENDRILTAPNEEMDPRNVGYKTKEGHWEFRPGPKVANWDPYKVLPTLSKRTVDWIGEQKGTNPFFLYLALPSPHAPIIPNKEFEGTSNAGGYGDFMVQTDWVAGQVLEALENNGLEENTLVIFTSDNGPENYAWKRAEKYGHASMAHFRGLKRDVWEGGHHVPFVVKWPGKIAAGSQSNELISQIDLMATIASITGIELPEKAAPDSYDFSQVFFGENYESPLRDYLVHNTYASIWGIRKEKWLYINDSTGGHRIPPETFRKERGYKIFNSTGILFDLNNDPGQLNNLYDDHPELSRSLDSLLIAARNSKASHQKRQELNP